uniref:NADH dehydrogenase subunit 6 n=1 Tax=Saimiri cassiquiarensis TaxID=2946521 RepID=UPI00203698A1|nr:NADH dehydrogenase subunit 6 [Saimiri cassiquiarensis]YP_010409893.1 NADH dehydrogenase subunit 6 [Saimiri macrodon]URH14765.1 NADH dehydrogenase subunit 6 [Saimiri cassiquiarensis]URH14791.1 NADH dehydrogenase subunit 6 [Saimiri cassiquiarensis]URH14804.1 NADH dehydrogenase subunit 6 [Saimiri cassiquiarensis]URH14817.1 NADH dehydrogenase subunit 6 [Saimiri cassiquiarensis]URH14830.1 NADH dehydrogenase subunit 6 [Saimiri cassiquiarensis]
MTYALFSLSVTLVMGFVGFCSKPSPIYGGLVLIFSGAVGCAITLYFGGSYMGLMVFLIYLGGMMVVFGYTAAMATDEHPESWVSSVDILGMFVLGMMMETMMLMVLGGDYKQTVEVTMNYKTVASWMIHEGEGPGLIREDPTGAGALYNYGVWVVLVTCWALFMGMHIAIELTRGGG